MTSSMDSSVRTGFLKRHGDLLLTLLLVAVTGALFWPATGFSYINLDDYPYVAANPMVAGGLTWDGIRQAFTTVHEFWWLPLLWMSYMLDISIFGPGPHGHHVMNILLHGLNAGLLFWVLRRLTGSRWRSLLVAALFAWHPLRVESVAWIAARKDVLSGLFFMLALLAYVRHVEHPSRGRMALVTGLMLAGLMSKAILLVLPFLLVLLDYWPLQRVARLWGRGTWKEWRPLLMEKIPLFGLSGLFIGMNLVTHRIDAAGGDGLSPLVRLGLIPPNYWAYLGKFFLPEGLSILHPDVTTVAWGVSLLAAAGLLGITVLVARFRKQAPYGLVGWLWFGVALFPVIRGVRLGLAGYADRFLYLPSIGVTVALVWGAAVWAERKRRPVLLWSAAAVVLAGSAWATARYLPAWQDSGTVFGHARRSPPVHPLSILNHGVWLMASDQLDEAEQTYKVFLQTAPGEPRGLGGLGRVLALQGRTEEAREVLAPSMAENEPFWTVAEAQGMALLQEGRAAEALLVLESALDQRPGEVGLRMNTLRAAFEAGDEAAAVRQTKWLQAAGVASVEAALFAYHADLWRQGGRVYAWKYFERLIKQEPENAALLNNLAWLAGTDGKTPPEILARAENLAERAVDLTGGANSSVLDTLGVARAAAGDYAGAIEVAERAVELAPDSVKAASIMERLNLYRLNQPYRD